ncbi:hypothetical protein FB451DRAFT_1195253 [Mycena latifolia]|nr:hypothetical protein FB451DRAFT_1195253 [Mycena latifolia]
MVGKSPNLNPISESIELEVRTFKTLIPYDLDSGQPTESVGRRPEHSINLRKAIIDISSGDIRPNTATEGCATFLLFAPIIRTYWIPLGQMHRCFEVPELVGLVCSSPPEIQEWEDKYGVRKPGRRVVARTCTAFYGPAIDVLWRSASLMNLICCLPLDFVEIADASGLSSSIGLLRPIQASDWQRVLVYAPRIKSLSSNPDYFELSAGFSSISLCLPDSLLPNLQALDWWHGENDFHYIHSFLSPNLTSITIPSGTYSALSLLSTLALKCPNLKDVSLWDRYDGLGIGVGSTARITQIWTFVCGLKGLEAISSAPGLDLRGLEHLSRLPNLRKINLCTLPTTLPVPPTVDTPAFASGRWNSALKLWRRPNSFDGANILAPTFATADQIHEFYTALAKGLSHSSVTHLTLRNDDGDFDMSAYGQYLIRPHSIRILFCFENLKTVCILSPVGIDLDNDTVTELARSWHRIEYLELTSCYDSPGTPRLTAQSLQSFATYCPHLRNLTITLNGTIIPISHNDSNQRLPQNSLRHLDVAQSPIEGPISVARFLSGVFSHLEGLRTDREFEDNTDPGALAHHAQAIEWHRKWKEVEALFPHLVAIRAEERARVQQGAAVQFPPSSVHSARARFILLKCPPDSGSST